MDWVRVRVNPGAPAARATGASSSGRPLRNEASPLAPSPPPHRGGGQGRGSRRSRHRALPIGNPTVNFHGEKRSNETHSSTTDPEAKPAPSPWPSPPVGERGG